MIPAKELKILMHRYNFHPRKKLGQNFLIDENIARNIISAAGIKKDDTVLEIGSGLGQLTEELANRAKFVYAVEYDKRLYTILKERLSSSDNLSVVCNDLLKLNIKSLLEGEKIKVVGNLPYYATTPIILKLLNERRSINELFITVQKEVAQRLSAKPATKDYGSITCYVNYFTKPEKLFDIPKRAFYPQPEVDSTFLSLKILKEPPVQVKDKDLLFRIIRASFGQRRKTILNALSNKKELGLRKEKILEIFKKADVDPARRGETLTLEEFATLANTWYNYKSREEVKR